MNVEERARPTKLVNITRIKHGDTVIHQGEMKTVCNKDIKSCTFTGVSIFGDSYMAGHLPVKLVIIDRALPLITNQ